MGRLCDHPRCAEFLRRLPKVELHQHLSGSYRAASVLEILRRRGVCALDGEEDLVAPVRASFDAAMQQGAWAKSLARFSAVNEAAREEADQRRLLSEVLADLAADGVVYAELRIGPKQQPTKAEYLQRLERWLEELTPPGLTVRLLVSVARHRAPADGRGSVAAALVRAPPAVPPSRRADGRWRSRRGGRPARPPLWGWSWAGWPPVGNGNRWRPCWTRRGPPGCRWRCTAARTARRRPRRPP